jgi:hypothetical protein
VLISCALGLAVIAGLRGTWSPCGLSMVSSINPFTERARGHRYAITCAWFLLGAVAGGLALGGGAALLALVVGVSAQTALALGLVATLVTLCSDLRLGGWSLPIHPRQVEESWLRTYRPWVYGVGFGAQIGVGLATYVMTAATYLVVVLAALSGSPALALLIGGVFGLVRGSAVFLGATARTPEALRVLHRRLDELGPLSLRVAVLAQAAVAVLLAADLAGPAAAVGVAALVTVLAAPVGLLRRRLAVAHLSGRSGV